MNAQGFLPPPTPPGSPVGGREQRVVYLLGAGATQGCISHAGSRHNLLMSGLAGPISEALQAAATHPGITRLINDVLMSESPGLDFEQLITFLEDSPTRIYRDFSDQIRDAFSSVLIERLDAVEKELGQNSSRLYAALVDMYSVQGTAETLGGFLTLNYDLLLERALIELGRGVDYGVNTSTLGDPSSAVKVLKLHGSFGWSEEWPIHAELRHTPGFWIPPGIRKSKNEYPFNAIWGSARELLACDVLRIIGCNLGPNDWDLVSLLFSTRHTHASAQPYRIEVISDFATAERIKKSFPYLDVSWLPELPGVGEQVVGEALQVDPVSFSTLSEEHQKQVTAWLGSNVGNPFRYWLTLMGEAMATDRDLSTQSGIFDSFVASGR